MTSQPRRAVALPAREQDARAADRALLLERIAVGLAHEGKNPLHNMMLHVQLMAEKLSPQPGAPQGSPIERHLKSLRDGIGRVDTLLRNFGEFASPERLAPDLGAAIARSVQLFAYETRRFGVEVSVSGPDTLLVKAPGPVLVDLVAHALVAGLELARDGGKVALVLTSAGGRATLTLRADGGVPHLEEAQPHLAAARRLAALAGCEVSLDAPSGAGARLSLSFVHPG